MVLKAEKKHQMRSSHKTLMGMTCISLQRYFLCNAGYSAPEVQKKAKNGPSSLGWCSHLLQGELEG